MRHMQRAVHGILFSAALIATLQFWSQVGGQVHLDLIPWWWKAAISLAIAACAVKLATAATRPQALGWLALIVVLMIAAGALTYYAHLNEPQDEEDQQDEVVPTLLQRQPQLPRPVRYLNQQRSIVL